MFRIGGPLQNVWMFEMLYVDWYAELIEIAAT